MTQPIDLIQLSETITRDEIDELLARWILYTVQQCRPVNISTTAHVIQLANEAVSDMLFDEEDFERHVLDQIPRFAEEYVRDV